MCLSVRRLVVGIYVPFRLVLMVSSYVPFW
jgi:hypothetical protein